MSLTLKDWHGSGWRVMANGEVMNNLRDILKIRADTESTLMSGYCPEVIGPHGTRGEDSALALLLSRNRGDPGEYERIIVRELQHIVDMLSEVGVKAHLLTLKTFDHVLGDLLGEINTCEKYSPTYHYQIETTDRGFVILRATDNHRLKGNNWRLLTWDSHLALRDGGVPSPG